MNQRILPQIIFNKKTETIIFFEMTSEWKNLFFHIKKIKKVAYPAARMIPSIKQR